MSFRAASSIPATSCRWILSNYVYIGQYDNPAPYYNQLRQQETFIQPSDPRFPTGWPV